MNEENFGKIIKVEYVENNNMQPFETDCPKCKAHIYSDVPQITIICPRCGTCLVRKGFENKNFVTK